MPSVEESILIAAPPEEVFDYVEDPANFAAYQGAVLYAGLDGDGPIRAGSRVQGASLILGRSFDWIVEVIVHERPRKIAFRTLGDRIGLTVCNTMTAERGGTRLTHRAEAGPQLEGAFGPIAAALAQQAYQQQVRADLAALAEILTGKGASAGAASG